MRFARFVVHVVLSVAAATPFASSLSAEEPAGQVLGLVKERPSEGRFVETDQGFMVPYTVELPMQIGDDKASFTMVPVPGGTFRFGSPEGEAGRQASEGPAFEVKVEPFWIADKEVSWAEYQVYMALGDLFVKFQVAEVRPLDDDHAADVISAPSNLYDSSFTYGNGDQPNLPAVTMSQYAAKQYTKFVSLLTGQFYRLPTEAEWEYAARAGSDKAYFFGDDPAQLAEYAWYVANSDDTTHPVGEKKPSPWGLYDIYGNAAEWTLDAYTEEGYAKAKELGATAAEIVQWPETRYPRTLRGGTYAMEAEQLRSASRWASSDDEWREEDPNVPKSPWWFTEKTSLGVGMRIIRPLNPPKDAEAKEKFWKADVAEIQEDVDYRIDAEGRGAYGWIDQKLPEVQKAVEEK